MKQFIKRLLLPCGRKSRRLLGGVSRGLLMELDLQNQTQRLLGLDEREIMSAVNQGIDTCASLVDVGASDGFYTLAFLRSRARRVIACEPSGVATRLLANAAANGFVPDSRFTIVSTFVGTGADKASIRELLRNLPSPVFLKVDIDGGELDLLHSCDGSDRLNDLRWVLETHSVQLERDCQTWFKEHGYRVRMVPNAPWRWLIPETRPVEQNRWLVATPIAA